MKITVRMFYVPADITFDLNDVKMEVKPHHTNEVLFLHFDNDVTGFFSTIAVDREHYLAEKSKVIDK